MWNQLLIIILSQMVLAAADGAKQPQGYLAKIGPVPIRFKTVPSAEERMVLKPLVMTDTGEAQNELNSLTNLTFLDQPPRKSFEANTNVTQAAPELVVPAPVMGVQTEVSQAQPIGNIPGGSDNQVVTPQMFLRFFNTNSGSETVISAPIKQQQPVSTPPSSTATYISQ